MYKLLSGAVFPTQISLTKVVESGCSSLHSLEPTLFPVIKNSTYKEVRKGCDDMLRSGPLGDPVEGGEDVTKK